VTHRVSIRRSSDCSVEEAVRAAVEDLGGLERFVGEGDRVLVKPNVCYPKGWETGTTTRPEVVEAIARLTLEAGAANPADGSLERWVERAIGTDGPNAVLECTGSSEALDRRRWLPTSSGLRRSTRPSEPPRDRARGC